MEHHSRQRYEDYKSFMRRHQELVWLKFDTMTSRTEWQQRVWVGRAIPTP